MLSELDVVFPQVRDTPAAAFGSHQNKSFKIEIVIFFTYFKTYIFHINQFELSLQDSNLMKKWMRQKGIVGDPARLQIIL